MLAIAIDDEQLKLYALLKAVRASEDIDEVVGFSNCDEALDWAEINTPDVAFLDINMRGINGLGLAEKITALHPDCKIVFCTGYEEYAVSAFKIHASGYLIKPISAEDVQKEIDVIKGRKTERGILKAKCFGNFDISCGGEKLNFKRSKSKEMLAYLIDRNGADVSSKEISAALWEDGTKENNRNYFHQLLFDVRQALEKVGAGEVLKKNGYLYSVDTTKIACDYYSYLKTGQPEFQGEYMTQYSWADETCGLLWSKNNK